jgi:general secretion pathway protein I
MHGFTLLEVLVALTIIAIALAALLRATGLAANNSDTLRLKMLAGWEAENQLALLRARHEWPDAGTTQGQSKQDGRLLLWKREVSNTPNPRFRKVVIHVYGAERPDYQLAELSGYALQEGF